MMFSEVPVPELKFSNCREYLLFAAGLVFPRVAADGRGDPDKGVYARLPSRPAKESYRISDLSKEFARHDDLLYFASSGWHKLSF